MMYIQSSPEALFPQTGSMNALYGFMGHLILYTWQKDMLCYTPYDKPSLTLQKKSLTFNEIRTNNCSCSEFVSNSEDARHMYAECLCSIQIVISSDQGMLLCRASSVTT